MPSILHARDVYADALYWLGYEARSNSKISPDRRLIGKALANACQRSKIAFMQPQDGDLIRRVQVVADDRERTAQVVEILRAIHGVEVIPRRLKTGDYQIQDWLFERKTLLDLAESIKDGRLFSQANRLVSAGWSAALILEGKVSDLAQSRMRREALQGALISLSLVFQIPILRSFDPVETAHLLLYAGQQLQRAEADHVWRHGKRPKRKRRLQLYVLQGLPGIGPQKAERLLRELGSVERVMTAKEQDLRTVAGIGEKLAARIRWILEPDGVSSLDEAAIALESEKRRSAAVEFDGDGRIDSRL